MRETHRESCTLNVLTQVSFVYYFKQASLKGASQTVVGLIFSCFELVIFLSAPIYGNFVSHAIRERGSKRDGGVEGVGNSDICLLTAGHLLNFMEATVVLYCLTRVLQSQNTHIHVCVLVHMPAHMHTRTHTHMHTHDIVPTRSQVADVVLMKTWI